VIRTLRSLAPAQLSLAYSENPEKTIDRSKVYRLRYSSGEIGVFCPFEKEWNVQQGFSGEWTHKGPWKHALDFVKLGSDQKTFKNLGYELTDYYAFSELVLAPMSGYVVGALSSLQDNKIGSVDNLNNWGNYIIIRSYTVYAVLAHLKKDSLTVSVGDFVIAGQKIAECGNSGYSQEPHLHLQMQYSAIVGGYTVPFHLLNYSHKNAIFFNAVPKQGETIAPLPLYSVLDQALTFKIGEVMKFKLKNKVIHLSTLLDETSGFLYLSDPSGAKLYFSKIGTQFYFYGPTGNSSSILVDLFLSAPKIPMTYGDDFDFHDHLPLMLTENFFARWFKIVSTLFANQNNKWQKNYHFNAQNLEITGINSFKGRPVKTLLGLDPVKGIMKFTIEDRNYERIY
jgi:murein DD-endopeptidase MepM/ murein hydrolase activator NlpD